MTCSRSRHAWPSLLSPGAVLLALGACAGEPEPAAEARTLPSWTFDASMIFPADGSLQRPEDGVMLADGRLLVADQAHGLRLVELDGRSAPFGTLVAAGYRHAPPAHPGGANGVSLEPSGTHVLVADIFGGAIFRVELATGAAEKLYQHQYGINAAVRDGAGTVWFTQSAHNRPEDGEDRMWATVNVPVPEGAVYRLRMTGDRPAGDAELVVDSLYFANGIAVDEARGHLYVAEIMGNRVHRFSIDPTTGALGERMVVVDSLGVDNLEFDPTGRLWMAAPVASQVLVLDPATGSRQVVFRHQTPAQQAVLAEILRRGAAGEPILELLGPDLWAPMPSLVTGVIVGAADQPVYLTGLGNALIRLPR